MKKIAVIISMAGLMGVASLAQAADFDSVDRKLTQISEKQDQILQQMEEIKSEIQVIKVRSSNP